MSKTVAEVYPLTVDFSRLLPSGATVDASNSRGSSTVKAYESSTEVPTLIVDGSTTTSGTSLQAWIQGGTAGKKYRIEFTAATSDGRILQHSVYVSVEA